MAKTYIQNADGSLTIKGDNGANPNGTPALEQWDIPALQIKPHVDSMAKTGERFSDMKAGDKTAALDAYHQAKERAAQDERNR